MSLELLLGISIVLLLALLMWVVLKMQDLSRRLVPADQTPFTMIQTQMNQLQKDMGDRMTDTNTAIRQQFASSSAIVRDVTEKLTRVEESAKQVLDLTGQLQGLQDMLKNPKQRGILGEYYLETLLRNILPPDSFKMQYAFKDGEIVDAAVFIRDKIIPVDSKFSLENYNRLVEEPNQAERDKLEKQFINDLKNRVVETSKYIRPQEGTMEFAFMFIPHEAIYYDLLINKIGAVEGDTESIIQRAAGKYHVIIVSPTSFLAYLQTVLQGLKALQIEEQAKEIKVRIADLERHLGAYDQFMKGVGKNLGTTVNQYNLAYKEFGKIDKDILRITGTGMGVETLVIDKPTITE